MKRWGAERFGQRFSIAACKHLHSATGHLSAKDPRSYSVLLRIQVTVQGVGISPEEQARLFQVFTQVDGSFPRKYDGTGLRLIISKRLAVLMGGDVRADSTPGVGSTFWFIARLQRDHDILPTDKAISRDVTLDHVPDSAGELTPDPIRARAELRQLESLLATDDTAAETLFNAHRPVLLAMLGLEAAQLEQQVTTFDYPGALVTLLKIIREMPNT